MPLLDRIRGWLTRTSPIPPEDGYSAFMSTYGTPSQEKILPTYQQFAYGGFGGNAVVFSVIGRRMSVFTEASLKFRRLSDKRLFGDTSLARLENPWPDGTTGDLFARMLQDVDLAGNAYVRNAGEWLERLRPDWVTVVSTVTEDPLGNQFRKVIGYYYDPIGDTERTPDYYPVEEVAHWAPIPDPMSNFLGMSWLSPVVREVNSDVRMSEFRDAFFKNAASPNVVVRYKGKIAPATVDRMLTTIQAKHAGPGNAFNTMILDEGADLTVVGADMQGSAFNDLQSAGETRIAAAGGVPALVVGLREGMQSSQIGEYEQAMRAFADLTMRPLWRSVCAALAKLVDVPPGAQLWYDTSDVSALRQGEKDAADTMVQMASAYNQFFMAGCDPDSITAALSSGDVALLKHTGLVSVQAQGGSRGAVGG